MKTKFLGLITLVSILTTCSVGPKYEATQPALNMATIESPLQEVPVAYNTVSDLSLASDVIIIGIPVATRGIINAARDPDDLTKPDPRYYGVSEVFEVQVEEYLKGDGLANIYVIQSQGFLIVEDKIPSAQEIEQERMSSKTIPLKLRNKYLLFLKKIVKLRYENLPEEMVFTGTGHPWIFNLNNPECVFAEDTLDYVEWYFPPQPYSMLARRISDPDYDEANSIEMIYPQPVVESLCESKDPQPYP